MRPHIIKLEDLQGWLNDSEITFAKAGTDKELACTLQGSFRLYYKKELVWQGIQPFTAVENYNNVEEYLAKKNQVKPA